MGWLMMGLGIFFTLLVGCGLMVLIFYSSRAGFDEPPEVEFDENPEPRRVQRPSRRRGAPARPTVDEMTSTCETRSRALTPKQPAE
jgi:hypothetical protein